MGPRPVRWTASITLFMSDAGGRSALASTVRIRRSSPKGLEPLTASELVGINDEGVAGIERRTSLAGKMSSTPSATPPVVNCTG
jgi:hypothetical protein